MHQVRADRVVPPLAAHASVKEDVVFAVEKAGRAGISYEA
jgi:hypothetical protein